MGERRPLNAIAFDIETGEFPGNDKNDALSPWHGRIRLMQVGDAHTGWAIPWETWSGVFFEVMKDFNGPMIAHNIAFEGAWMTVHAGHRWKFPWERMHDTMLMSQIIDPAAQTHALKKLTSRLIDPAAPLLQQQLEEDMVRNGWTWGTIPEDWPSYKNYGALDPVITARLFHDHFYPKVAPGTPFSLAYELEMNVRRIATTMEVNGARVDLEYSKEKYNQLMEYSNQMRIWSESTYGYSITSPIQMARLFEKLGAPITKRTASGAPSVDKEQLEIFKRDGDAEVKNLAEAILNQRKAAKIASSYFENFINRNVNGLLHPNIMTSEARTGRMCLPTSHGLLTDRGVVPVDNIHVGDKTLDKDGNWVTVRAVHRYESQEIVSWSPSLASTREHRWVWKYDDRNRVHIEPTHAGKHHLLQLAPLTAPGFDFTAKVVHATTEGEQFAALIGMLITDGTCRDYGHGIGLRATVYQTENKFYQELLRIIPTDALMYDRSRPVSDSNNVLHELRIKARWLRPRLSSAGISMGGGHLKDSLSLVSWISHLPLNEVSAFFGAAFLCDGSTAVDRHKIIASQSEVARLVFQIAGYRLGYSSSVFEMPPSEWSNGNRFSVRFKNPVFGLRNAHETVSTSDVWCVSTDTGTFTAWSTGPYLTGNSIREPALQTLPSGDPLVRDAFIPRHDGEVFVTADLDQVEFRLMANFSEDPKLMQLFLDADASGGDVFTSIMRQVYKNDGLQKSDPRRKLIKGYVYGSLYGAGIAKQALTAGVPEEVMREVAHSFESNYPGVKLFQRRIEQEGQARLLSEGVGYVLTKEGRRLPADDDRMYALVNYMIQGSAAEIFKKNLIKIDQADLTEYMVVPVHDEIVLSVPKDIALDVKTTVRECMTTRDGWTVPLTSDAEGPFASSWGEKYHGH